MHGRSFVRTSGIFFSLITIMILFSLLFSSAAALQASSPSTAGVGPTQLEKPSAASPVQAQALEQADPLAPDELQSDQIDPADQSKLQQEAQEQARRLQAVNANHQGIELATSRQVVAKEMHLRLATQNARASVAEWQLKSGLGDKAEFPGEVYAGQDQKPQPEAAAVSSAVYRITLQTLHRNTTTGNHSSFYFINDGSSAANYSLEFFWPNDQIAATEAGIVLTPGEKYNYFMQNTPNLPGVFVGKVVISSDQPVSGQIFSSNYGLIQGQVFEDNGTTPMAGSGIGITSWPDLGQNFGGMGTLSDGRYYVGGLSDGSYSANSWTGYPWASQWYSLSPTGGGANEIVISAASTASNIDFILQRGGKITGTVYAADGVTPIPSVNIDIEQGGYGTCSDANGYYEIQVVPYGSYKVVAGRGWNWCLGQSSMYKEEYYNNVPTSNLATPVPVNAGQDILNGIDFTLETGGQIKGRVVSAATGDPLADIHIEAHDFYTNQGNHGTQTDANGDFTIGGLIAGDYNIYAADFNDDGVMWAKEFYPEQSDPNNAGKVTVSDTGVTTGIDFTLDPGGTISGQIVDTQTGLPLANINVDFEQGWFGTCTDSNGYYQIISIPFGNQYVSAARDWNWCTGLQNTYLQEYYNNVYQYEQATPVQVGAGQEQRTGIDFSLETGGTISGRVVAAATGDPLANIQVDAVEFDNGKYKSNAWTDANGDYTLTGLFAADYKVMAGDHNEDGVMWAKEFYPEANTQQGAGRVTVSGSGVVSDINFTLEPGGSIAGQVIDTQTGLPQANINVDLEQGYFGACTDANGNYYIPSVPFGGQLVTAARDWNWCTNQQNSYMQEYYDGVYSQDQATPVQVGAGQEQRTGIDFSLAMGGTISGRVIAKDTGDPIGNIRVNANDYNQGKWGKGANTNPDGTFTIPGLPDGTYRVEARDEDATAPQYAKLFYQDTYGWDQATPVQVSSGGASNDIDFALEIGGNISGTVYDQATGLPIPDLCLRANRDTDGAGDGTCTDGQGHYTIWGLPFGDYQVNAGGNDSNATGGPAIYAQELYHEAIFRWDATLVSIQPGSSEATGIDFTLEKGGFISGHVEDEGGQPVQGVRMVAQVPQPWCQDCTEWVQSNDSDANGNYTIGPLPAGDFAVYGCPNCNGNNLYYNEYYNNIISFTEAQYLAVLPDTTTANINFTLGTGIQVNGTVSVPNGYSLQYIDIDIWRNDGPWYNTNVQTDAQGHYQAAVPPLNDSNWAVRAIPRGTDLGGGRVEQVDLNKQAAWDFDLLPGGSISGQVLSGGVPLSGVNLNSWSIWFSEGTQSDSNGNFTIHNLPAGEYELNAELWPDYTWQYYHGYPWSSYRKITLDSGQSKSGFVIDLKPKGRIEGHVYDQDGTTPLENLRITAVQGVQSWNAWTNTEGYYTLDLAAGPTSLLFIPDNWENHLRVYYPGVMTSELETLVNVPTLASGSLTVDQELPRRGSLSGHVSDIQSGQPLPGILVSAILNDPAADMAFGNSTCTDKNGDYFIVGLAPGPNRVTVVGTCGNNIYPNKLTQDITITGGANLTLNLNLTAADLNPRPFTIWTYDSWDYTPFTYGGANFSSDTEKIIPALFTPLVGLNDQNEWISDLLTSIPSVENGGAQVVNNQLVVTYHLKPGLLWSDGAPLTSADIRFTWQTLTWPNPIYGDGGWASVLSLWEIESIDLPDAQTAVVTFRDDVFQPGYLQGLTYLLPEHVLAGKNPLDMVGYSSYAHYPVGNGPYIVEDWVPGSHLDLRPNPNYVRRGEGLPKIENLRIQFAGDPYDQLQRGLLDVVFNGDPNWNLNGSGLVLQQTADNNFQALVPNDELPFFSDPAVRRALAQAIDKQSFFDLYPNAYLAGEDYLSPEHPMRGGTLSSHPFNLAAAASGLNAAGWTDHDGDGLRDKNGVVLDFDLAYRDTNLQRRDLAAIIQEDLAGIGVKANLLALDWETFYQRARHGELDCYILGWFMDNLLIDPQGYASFHSRSIPTGYNSYQGSWFSGRWQDPTTDSLMEAARQELSRPALENLYAQHQTRFTSELPIWVIGYGTRNLLVGDTLVGFKPHGITPATWNIQDWYLPPNPYDLSMRKALSLNSPAAQPGATLEYSLQVTNLGYFTVNNAVLIDLLPANLSYVSATPAPSTINGRELRWNLGNLGPNQVAGPILVRAQVSAGANHGDLIENNAQVWMDQVDSHPENNGILHTLTVREDVDLSIEKYGVGQGAVGEPYEYYLNYRNQGGAPASSLAVSDTLPAGVTYLSANPSPDSVVGQTLTWNKSSLAGGQWGQQIQINTEINAAGTITNQAGINSPDSDVNPSNNQTSASETVDAILAPVITRPTGGVTDGTPTVYGAAPASALVRIYDISGNGPQRVSGSVAESAVLLGSTTANAEGEFEVELNLAEGGYILAATAEKSGLVSGYSNTVAITVDHHLPLDPDEIQISADGVDLSMGCVQAERYVLPYQQMNISAVINCPEAPNARIKVIENGQFTYYASPVQTTDLGGAWQVDFRVWLGEAHSTYQVFLEWDCQDVHYQALLLYILVDPDGFLYDQAMVDAGTPIEEALITDGTVTIYVWDDEQWKQWPAGLYNQFNPQVTDGATADGVLTAGYYSFLTPSGQYKIEANAPGYLPYQSPVITVITTPVRLDIGLTPLTAGIEVAQSPANLSSSVLSADKDPVFATDILTYNLTLRNSGQTASGLLTLSDPIPAGTVYVANSLAWQGSGTASYDSGLKKVAWQGVVPAGGEVHVKFQVRVMVPPGGADSLTNTATVSGSQANVLTLPLLEVITAVVQGNNFLPLVEK